ncbi:unnamed protein product [Brassica oleracea var. botrytis]|uniref:Uncharacterized protein n=2 Tax=Brassica oleracea TaxID=3712 RepID=A0A0D3CZ67_BRAOL|nr:unnamed protein product [Brassica oleracea]
MAQWKLSNLATLEWSINLMITLNISKENVFYEPRARELKINVSETCGCKTNPFWRLDQLIKPEGSINTRVTETLLIILPDNNHVSSFQPTRSDPLEPNTTRKHRYSDDKYRRYALGITVFRKHTDENGRQKFLVGKQIFLGISSENFEGIPRIKDSEDIPKKHFLGLFVGISSDNSDGTVLGNIPREKRCRNIPRRYSEEICPQNIPRKLSSE